MCHYSFNSCNDISATFRAMFPDSGIAKTFTCGATKCAYLSCFGLAPYFHEQLVDMVRSTACYSISFDECINRISQNEQMDFIIRYWDGNTNKVAERYLGSEFLGHATAVDLLTHFKQGISRLDPKRLLQVSMDGPNVNWKFYTDLTKERNSEELPQLLNIGCCCCLPTPMTLASGGSPMFPHVVHQPASPSIWPAVQSLRRGLSTNPGVTMWCVCGCS